MCHLILLLPVAALPVFWLLPASDAGVLYAAVTAVSIGVYVLVLRAMRAPVVAGIEALTHRTGSVRSLDGRKAWVWVRSELWSAEAADGTLQIGDEVEVIGARGLVLQVRRIGPCAGTDPKPRPHERGP